jgi:hypothetical protein
VVRRAGRLPRRALPGAAGPDPAQGNAIVFAQGNQLPGGLSLPALQGPTVAMVPNPNDATAKLLLVMGRDGKELKIAANAVAVGSPALSGQSATITSLTELKPRKPYDAPNWLASDRPSSSASWCRKRTSMSRAIRPT